MASGKVDELKPVPQSAVDLCAVRATGRLEAGLPLRWAFAGWGQRSAGGLPWGVGGSLAGASLAPNATATHEQRLTPRD